MYAGTFRVLPRGRAMVQNYEQMGSVRRYLGWKHDPKLGSPIKDPITKQPGMSGKFFKMRATEPSHVIEVPDRTEYRRAIKAGDLWPADQDTASKVGVTFDPNFGGEHDLQAPAPVTVVTAGDPR